MLQGKNSKVRGAALGAMNAVAQHGHVAELSLHAALAADCLRDECPIVRRRAGALLREIAAGGGAAALGPHIPQLVESFATAPSEEGCALLWALIAAARGGEARTVAPAALSSAPVVGALAREILDAEREASLACAQAIRSIVRVDVPLPARAARGRRVLRDLCLAGCAVRRILLLNREFCDVLGAIVGLPGGVMRMIADYAGAEAVPTPGGPPAQAEKKATPKRRRR